MKKLIFLTLWAFATSAFSQKIDTLYVNESSTTYLIFVDAITLFNLGNADFTAQSSTPQVLFLKAKSVQSKPSTLFLTHGGQIFQAYLLYQSPLNKPFYDFRTEKPPSENLQNNDKNKLLDEKFKKLAAVNFNIEIKEKKSGISVACKNLFNDDKGTYKVFLKSN